MTSTPGGDVMVLRFTSESGHIRLEAGVASGEEQWPQPIRVGLTPDPQVVTQAAEELPEGVPLVIQLETGRTYELNDLTRMAEAAGESGRDMIILSGDE